MQIQQLLDEALKLDVDERYALAHHVLDSLPQPDPRIEKLWAEEAVRRLRAYDEGRDTRTYSLDEALGDDA